MLVKEKGNGYLKNNVVDMRIVNNAWAQGKKANGCSAASAMDKVLFMLESFIISLII